VALVAGLIAALIARGFGDVGLVAALIVGVVTFGVYGVLLGSGGVEVTVTESHGAGHDDHGHH
jgi:parvulin-like peptidyl-prolyl isomerase